MAPVCHEHYYMKDGVTFLVENTLFRVPRYMLETTSPVFAAMLSDVRPDATPISLRDATSVEFERLLTFLYPLAPPVDTVAKPWDEHQWTSILRLATMWEMAEIRAVAMRLLGQIHDPFMKVTLGRQYGHQPWIKEGFMMLCLRPEPLTVEEGVQLTKEDVIACAAAREEIRLRVLPREHKRLTNRVHSSRRICAKESGPVANIMEYQQFFNRSYSPPDCEPRLWI
ncbi:hypothetical protein K439DRAFT_1634745 [Ramaria rubella]|nr:hypothetical protein K439DRAFT_1634745 [Ramaria rubella]